MNKEILENLKQTKSKTEFRPKCIKTDQKKKKKEYSLMLKVTIHNKDEQLWISVDQIILQQY